MRLLILVLGVFFAVELYGQTKEATQNNGEKKEIYTVLKVNKKAKNGKYHSVSGWSVIATTNGFYHAGAKDSLWAYYLNTGLIAEGFYKKGIKVGIWAGYEQGEMRVKYDFTNQNLMFFNPASVDTALTCRATGNMDNIPIERCPIYINGVDALAHFMNDNIRYPVRLATAGKDGGLVITVSIDENGSVTNYAIKNKLGFGADEEVLRVLSLIDGEWIPGIANGKPAAMEVDIPVLFELNRQMDIPHKPDEVIIIRAKINLK